METLDSKRQCRKCQAIIPVKIRIDGKTKNLRNRKFCFDCSPYKAHNTHPSDPGNPKGRRPSKERNRQQILSIYKRGLERKATLIAAAGGKCKDCGYCKTNRALSFHHREPAGKKFCLSINEIWSRSWDVVLEEAAKCDLLCMNCHMELENQNSEIVQAVNKKYGTSF